MAKTKKKLNQYFKIMLKSKKAKLKSFKYKGSTYYGKKHKYLGLIYQKAGSNKIQYPNCNFGDFKQCFAHSQEYCDSISSDDGSQFVKDNKCIPCKRKLDGNEVINDGICINN